MKAILIIDMPNSCIECPFCNEENKSCLAYMNFKAQTIILLAKGQKKSIWCPLKPLPQKIDIYEKIYQAYGHGNDETYQRIRQAVEGIYDEILGGEEE